MKKNNLKIKIIKYLRQLKLLDLVGVGIFFIVLIIAFLFFRREAKYVEVLLRISETDELDSWKTNPPVWFFNQINLGLEERGESGKLLIGVEDVYYYSAVDKGPVFTTLKIRAKYNSRTNQYTYKNRPLLVGDYYVFRLNSLELRGIIYEVEENINKSERKNIIVEGYLDPVKNIINNDKVIVTEGDFLLGMDKHFAEEIKEGMQALDSNGEPYIKILNVESAYVGNIGSNNLKYNIRVRVELSLDKVGDNYYFRYTQPVKVGDDLYFNFSNINFVLTTTSVLDE